MSHYHNPLKPLDLFALSLFNLCIHKLLSTKAKTKCHFDGNNVWFNETNLNSMEPLNLQIHDTELHITSRIPNGYNTTDLVAFEYFIFKSQMWL
jgi:hypothetical protein